MSSNEVDPRRSRALQPSKSRKIRMPQKIAAERALIQLHARHPYQQAWYTEVLRHLW